MSDDRTTNPESSGNVLAAEYVLGVLSADERRAVERSLITDTTLAADVAYWEHRLGGLASEVAPVTPPAATWSKIDAALRAPAPATRTGLWRSLGFWRGFSLASSALAVASVAGLIYVAMPPAPRIPLVATLNAGSGQANFLVAVTPGGTSVMIVPAALTNADQRALELWLIPTGDRPHSLGLIQPGQPVRVNVPAELIARMRTDAVLAVSVEPIGGSPTGQPTGPVIATGKLATL